MAYIRANAAINLDHLAHNVGVIRRLTPKRTRLMAVVKADGYGHGAVETARTALANGADTLGVAICEEGVQLREHQIDAPILIFGFTPEPLLDDVVKHRLIQTVFSADTARRLAKAAERHGCSAEVHIKIDTGMSRLGFLPTPASVEAICAIAALPALRVTGIYTHFATSDAMDAAFMSEQHTRFTRMLDALAQRGLVIPTRHMGNSGAFAQTLRGSLPFDVFADMIRVGILLYGLLPSGELDAVCAPLSLRPVMRLVTQVGMVKKIDAGAGVSYGHLYRTSRETIIATLPVGYADGYARVLSNKSHVLIGGQKAPLIGAICMDQCMADVTNIPGVAPGDEVVMIGEQNNNRVSADDLAALQGSIGYEVVCGVGKRVPRIYIKDAKAIKTLQMV